MVFVTDDADRVAIRGELRGGFLALYDPGAGRVDDLQVALPPHLLKLVARNAMGANDERSTLDLVGEVRRPDAPIRQVGLDARIVDELAEGGDVLPLVAGVLGLVD